MEPIQKPITGTEVMGDLATPYQALVQFYDAFNRRDLATMAENWAQSEDIAMDNPLGGIRRGWPEVLKVFEKIFSNNATVKVEFYDHTIHKTGGLFYAVERERLFSESDQLN